MANPLTLEFAQRLVTEVIDAESIQILRMTKANGTEISLAQQFVDFFYGHDLRFDEEMTIRKAVYIFSYSRHSVLKIKLYKDQIAQLLNPVNFFQTSTRGVLNDVVSSNINIADTSNIIDKKQLNFERSQNSNLVDSKSTERSAGSQFNEDDSSVEELGRQQDALDVKPNISAQESFDIVLPKDLSSADANNIIKKTEAIPAASLSPASPPNNTEISYTNVGVNKNANSSASQGNTAAKGLNVLYDKQTNKASTIQTNTGKTTGFIISQNFTYNDALFKTLNMQLQNFREMFFSSFSCLFVELWCGY